MILQLDRPLVILDLETTGINFRHDRIVEIGAEKMHPDGRRESYEQRINPGCPIPEETTAIHGISDADVKDCPPFEEVARSLLGFLRNCDLGGFGILRFDIPMLTAEFKRAGFEFPPSTTRVVDAQRIYHKMEPRTLSAALQFYCNEEHVDAHGARADVLATISVLEAQLAHYDNLPHTVDRLDAFCNPQDPDAVDADGKLRWRDQDVVINFGQKRGSTLRQMAATEPAYLNWMLRRDFSPEVKEMVKNALAGVFPQRSPETEEK